MRKISKMINIKKEAVSSFFSMTTILLSFLVTPSFKSYSQVNTEFNIDGNIESLKTGSKLCMVIKRFDKIDTVAKTIATNGVFKFKNVKLPVYPDFYLICIQTEFVENLNLFLDQAGYVKIKGKLKEWPNVSVIGSKTHDDYLAYIKLRDVAWKEYDSLITRGASKDKMKENNSRARLTFINERPDSFFIPYALITWKDEFGQVVIPEIKKPYFDRLPIEVKNSYYGKQLAKQMTDYAENKRWTEQLEKGIVALTSISRDETVKQLTETANQQVKIRFLPPFIKPLDNIALEAKCKAATLILNMAYRNAGDSITRVNPTSVYVIDDSGICVTNYHVGNEYSSKALYQSLSVMTATGKVYPVSKILSCSESDDLMVFKIDTKGDQLSALPLGNTLAEGKPIHVMGHPLGNFYRFTSGTISDYSTSTLADQPCNVMSITAEFNVGSSGGPIVDDNGNVVGTVSRLSGGMKVGVPVSELKKLLILK